MASPQKENGMTSIANEIVEALAKTQLNGYESRFLWALWRKTYGWHKKEDWISWSQLIEITGLRKQHIWRTKKSLQDRNIVTILGYKISFQKDYTQWRELPKLVTVTKSGTPVTKSGIKVTRLGTHKVNYTKETITKERLPDDTSGTTEKVNKREEYRSLISHCLETQSIKTPFVNYVKQATALKKIFSAGYSEEDIRFVMDEMAGDQYWKDQTFDCMNVANNMQKYLNRTVYFNKGGKYASNR
jgi:phage replication O-like protein O